MKRIFLISLLGVFVSVSAMGAAGPTIGGGELGKQDPIPEGPDEPTPTPDDPKPELPCGYFPTQSGDEIPAYSQTCFAGQYVGLNGAGFLACVICSEGNYCPDASNFCPATGRDYGKGLYSCPSNYDNTAIGLTSIEECCLNGYDETTGLCIESTPSAPRRVAIAPSATNADCDSETLETNSGSTTLTAEWTANTITLKWYNGDTQYSTNTCTYDSGITLPLQPTKTGYNFVGWKVKE
nr:InlB B-repeat-containing protein [Candidatus Enterousia merdequi]